MELLGQRGATVSRWMCKMGVWSWVVDVGAAAPDDGGRRGGGLGFPRYDGFTRQSRCLAWAWVATWMRTAWAEGSSTRLDRLRAMRRSIWLLHRGGGSGTGGFGGSLDEDCVGRGFVDLTRSPSGNAKVDLVAIPGRRPRNMVVLVATWMKTAWAEGSSTMTG